MQTLLQGRRVIRHISAAVILVVTGYPDDLLVLVGKLLEEASLPMAESVIVQAGYIASQHQHLTAGHQRVLLNILTVIVKLQMEVRSELN